MRENIIVYGSAFLLILLIMSGIMGCVYVSNAFKCDQLSAQTGLPTRFAFLGGGDDQCLIQANGQWVPTSNWRVID